MLNTGWDTETHLIGPGGQMIPTMVCGSWDVATPGTRDAEYQAVWSIGDADRLWQATECMWQETWAGNQRTIIHNAGFDVSVALRYCHDVEHQRRPGPAHRGADLARLIWDTLDRSMDSEWSGGPVLVSDTMLREKLLNLSGHGSVVLNRRMQNARYGLADLVYRYYKIDLRAGKIQPGGDGRFYDHDGNLLDESDPRIGDSWRLRYKELDHIPVDRWPLPAYTYALMDATYARWIWEAQEQRRDRSQHAMHDTIRSESLQVYTAVAAALTTATGFRVDRDQVERITRGVAKCLDETDPPLRAQGILRANGSINTKVVKARVEEQWRLLGRQPLLTDTGEIATSKQVMEIIADFDPALEAYARRQRLAKIRDAFLPALQGPVVYTQFDVLKETGRTSSYGSSEKKGRKPLFDAFNSQQVPRMPGVREALLPPVGMLIGAPDYTALELCSTAQATYNLLGWSIHRDKINAGFDLHTFLGSAIAMLKDPELVGHCNDTSQLDRAYHVLNDLREYRPPPGYFDRGVKDSEVEDRLALSKRAKHMRNLAKPVGLGFPGGLAEKTMIVLAKTVYKVLIDEYEASELKELWFHVYPEMVEYFKWVRQSRDFRNLSEGDPTYCYATPGFGRFRAGATYCATANGAAMQSLSADGAKRGWCWISRACSGGLPMESVFRILEPCLHLTFIHDENLIAIPDDPLATERARAASALMVAAMQVHMPDVHITAEPSLMRRWRKNADPEWSVDARAYERAWDFAKKQYGGLGEEMMHAFSLHDGTRLQIYEDVYGEGIRDEFS